MLLFGQQRPGEQRALPFTLLAATALLWLTEFVVSGAAGECVTVRYRTTPVCLEFLRCSLTPRSSSVRSVCYDAKNLYMLIKLKNTWYQYCAVDHSSVDHLLAAQSVGRYFNEKFRSHGPLHGPFDCRDHDTRDYR
jgi:KTSC domain